MLFHKRPPPNPSFPIQIRGGIAKALEGEVQEAAEKSMKPRSKKEDEALQFLDVDLFHQSFLVNLLCN